MSEKPPAEKYFVYHWESDLVLGQWENLGKAKRECRKFGHTRLNNGKYYAPVAFVGDEDGYVIYNPRFKMEAEK